MHDLPNGTTDPYFKVTAFFDIEYLKTTRDRATVTIERQYEVVCALSNGDISNDIDGPLTQFSRSRHFWSRILEKNGVS